jgi:hypothetical protein
MAAAGYAVWIPNILNVWSTSQEALYGPLILLAFTLLARAMIADAGRLQFGLAGISFGFAALTRSMPLFFVMPAALAHLALAPERRVAGRQIAALLLGFALVTLPYSVALSRHFGRITLIDTHGSIHFTASPGGAAGPPGVFETAEAMWQSFAAAEPTRYLAESASRARSLLQLNGGRLLQIYVVAATRATALAWKVGVHLGADALLIASVVLAPVGAAVCRNTRPALMFLLWAVVNVGVASLGGFGGARLRTPFEPLLLVLAAVVVAGGWRLPARAWLAAGIALGLMMSAIVLPQVPESLRAQPDYGIDWGSPLMRHTGRMKGTAGFSVPAYGGIAEFTVTPVTAQPTESQRIDVRIGGSPARRLLVAGGEERMLRYVWPARGLAFVEVDANEPTRGDPAELRVTIGAR